MMQTRIIVVLAAACLAGASLAACKGGTSAAPTATAKPGATAPAAGSSGLVTSTPAGSSGCSPPGASPKAIAILIQGIGSSVSAGAFNPATASYCASPDGSMPPDNPSPALRSLADGWLNYTYDSTTGKFDEIDQSTRGAGPSQNLMDALAGAGAYVLPFSYACSSCTNSAGAVMSGTASSPWFTVPGYTKGDVGVADPITTEPAILQAEIAGVHQVFPDTKIIVVGHSNGGLVAEQWWLQYGAKHPDGVAQVFSLDAPLNGAFDGAYCLLGLCEPFGIGPNLGQIYADLWFDQSDDDPPSVSLDNRDKLFTAVGSYGDPLYDAFDNGATTLPTTDARIGIISQLYFTEPSCAKNFPDPYDLSTSRCQPTGRYLIDPCAPASRPLDINYGPPIVYPDWPGFGLPDLPGETGDLWMHSVVKNCPGVIDKIISYVPKGPAVAATGSLPSPAPSAPPQGGNSPEGVTAAFYNADLQGNWTVLCDLLEPSSQEACRVVSVLATSPATGTFTIAGQSVQGDQALVAVTGTFTTPGPDPQTVTNSDPSSGMPPGAGSFAQAFAAAVAAASSPAVTVLSPIPCVEIAGVWYVDVQF